MGTDQILWTAPCGGGGLVHRLLKGAHGPKWTDGQELNYKRRRIEYQQEEMITHGFSFRRSLLICRRKWT